MLLLKKKKKKKKKKKNCFDEYQKDYGSKVLQRGTGLGKLAMNLKKTMVQRFFN